MKLCATALHYARLCALAFVLTALAGLAVHAGHEAPTQPSTVHAIKNGHS